MGKIINEYSGNRKCLRRWIDRLLSFPRVDPHCLARIRNYWIMIVGTAVFVLFLTLLAWAWGSKTLLWNGVVQLTAYGFIAMYIVLARRPLLWIVAVGHVFTIVVTFATIAILGGLFQSGGIIATAIASVLFSLFLLRPAWTFSLFALFCSLLIAIPFITPLLYFGTTLPPFANTMFYVINTLWITGWMVFLVFRFMREHTQYGEENARRYKENEVLFHFRSLWAGRSVQRRYYPATDGLEAVEPANDSEPGLSPIHEQLVHRLHQLVMARLDDPDLHVDDLCRTLGMSHAQLHRKLMSLTGMGANRFIRTLRLHEAAALLRNPERNVAEVAFDTGFRDPDYFGRAFRKMFGVSPSEYRAGEVL